MYTCNPVQDMIYVLSTSFVVVKKLFAFD